MEKQYKGAYFTPDKKAKIEWCLKWNEKYQGYESTALFRSSWPDEVWKDIDWELINNEF